MLLTMPNVYPTLSDTIKGPTLETATHKTHTQRHTMPCVRFTGLWPSRRIFVLHPGVHGSTVRLWTLQPALEEHCEGSASGRWPAACARTPVTRSVSIWKQAGARSGKRQRHAATAARRGVWGSRLRAAWLQTFVRMAAAAERCSTVTAGRGCGCGLARGAAVCSAYRGTRKKAPISDSCTLTLTSRCTSDSAPALSSLAGSESLPLPLASRAPATALLRVPQPRPICKAGASRRLLCGAGAFGRLHADAHCKSRARSRSARSTSDASAAAFCARC